jgi:hypothetical protein
MLQQIPGAKVIYINVGKVNNFVLCHTPKMGYYTAAMVRAADVVICAAHEANRIGNMLEQMQTILMVDGFGQESQWPMHDAKWTIHDLTFTPHEIQEPKPDYYQFVNEDGNLLRHSSQLGYYIDPSSPVNQIVKVDTGTVALEFLDEMRIRIERNGELCDAHGHHVNSKLFIQSVIE